LGLDIVIRPFAMAIRAEVENHVCSGLSHLHTDNRCTSRTNRYNYLKRDAQRIARSVVSPEHGGDCALVLEHLQHIVKIR